MVLGRICAVGTLSLPRQLRYPLSGGFSPLASLACDRWQPVSGTLADLNRHDKGRNSQRATRLS